MDRRDIVVIGASAGGIPALTALVAALPADLPAAIFVTVHVPPYAVSRLPEILSRSGPMPAVHAVDSDAIVPGRIYVAPPDRHMLLRDGHIELGNGPRENFCRPAIDPLFRTAARVYGPRVIGIVLSGALYDGSLGLLAVKTRGGIAAVQDPSEAIVGSMPRSAMNLVEVDHVLSVAGIAEMLIDMAGSPVADGGETDMSEQHDRIHAAVSETFVEQESDQRPLEPSIFPCPECGGVLWQTDGPVLGFQCHVGHTFAAELLLGHQAEQLEAALWTSLRLLKEKAALARQLAARAETSGVGRESRMAEQAARDEGYARAIQDLLEKLPGSMGNVPTGSD